MSDYRRDFESYDDRTLPISDLARIWRGLPETKRLLFTLSLREDIGDRLLAATCNAATGDCAPAGGQRRSQVAAGDAPAATTVALSGLSE